MARFKKPSVKQLALALIAGSSLCALPHFIRDDHKANHQIELVAAGWVAFPVMDWPFTAVTSLIKSIQTGEITIAATASSGTATVSTVGTGNSCVFYGGMYCANTSANAQQDFALLTLTNSTTVTAQTNTADPSFSRTVRYTLVEWMPGCINKIQTGTIFGGSLTNDATIANVITANSFVIHQGNTCSANNLQWGKQPGRISLLNSTTVRLTINDTSVTQTRVAYAVIEFVSGIVNSIQQIGITMAGSSATANTTISAVNDGSTITFNNGFNENTFGDFWSSDSAYIQRTSTTNVAATRGSANSAGLDIVATVIDFKAQYVKSRASGTISIGASATTNTAGITSVVTGKTLVSWNRFTGNDFSDPNTLPYAFAAIGLTNATTLTATKAAQNGSTTSVAAYDYMEFT